MDQRIVVGSSGGVEDVSVFVCKCTVSAMSQVHRGYCCGTAGSQIRSFAALEGY